MTGRAAARVLWCLTLHWFAWVAPCCAKVACVEPSRYAVLAGITEGDVRILARDLGGRGVPPADACRAALLTGPVDDSMVDDLLDLIRRERGWLAVVYLAFSDRDLAAEMRLAEAIRLFALEVVLLHTNGSYEPDFIAVSEPLPASLSSAWSEAERAVATPLDERVEDYLRTTPRLIDRDASACGLGCLTVLAAGVVRAQVWLKIYSGTSPVRAVGPSPDEDRVRALARARFGLEGAPIRRSDGWWAHSSSARYAPSARDEIERTCRPRIDYLASRRAEIAKAIDGYAARNFPNMDLVRLMPKLRAVNAAKTGVQQCAVQALGRLRAKAFFDACRDACTNHDLEQTIDARVARSTQESVAGPRSERR